MTKLTWDNTILIGPKMADRLQHQKWKTLFELEPTGEERSPARSGFKPAIPITPSRSHSATDASAPAASARLSVSTPTRFAPVPHRGSPPAPSARPASRHQLASTQGYQTMDTPDGGHRPLVRETSLDEYRKNPDFAHEEEAEPAPGLYALQTVSRKKKGLRVGHDHRPQRLRGLRQLHDRLRVREQHRRGRQGADRDRPPHALDSRRRLLPGRTRQSQSITSSPSHACSAKNAPCEVVCPVRRSHYPFQ